MSNANRIYERSTRASLYNENKIEFVHEPMFLGAGRNTQRFETLKYDYFDKSNDTQQGFDWKHDEISLIKDIKDFKGPMTIAERFVVTRTFQKLIFLDSLNGRGPFLTLGQIATLPELENVILTWNYFEAAKHSRTYTEELRALYDNPSDIFDESFSIPELTKISSSIRKPFERAYFNIIGYIYNIQRDIEITDEQMNELKISIVMLCIEINSLEGIRFYSSFAAIWALTEGQKYIPGTSENLSFICLHPESQVLTESGWKLVKQLELTDKIAQYDMETGEVTFDYPTRKIWRHYEGKMHKILDSNGNMIQHITRDHEVVVSRKNVSKGKFTLAKSKVQDVKFNQFVYFPQGGKIVSDNNIKITTLDRFRIMIQADGHINPRMNGSHSGHLNVVFSLKKQRKIDLFFEYCKELNIDVIERKEIKEGLRSFSINVPLEMNITKDLDWINLNSNIEYIDDLLLEMVKWDGSEATKSSNNKYCLFTSEQHIHDKIVAMIALSSYKLFNYKQENKAQDHYKTSHRIYFRKDPKIINTQTYVNIDYDYNGMIGCVTMPKGTIITKSRDDKICVTSNCRDENEHLALTQNILKNLRRKDQEGFVETYKKCMSDIEKRYIEVYNEELEWIDFLFSQGSYIGMNSNILKQYLTFITIKRMKGIGIKVTKEMLSGNWCEKNPLPWIDKYINMDLVEKLPQEEKVLNYVTGGVDQDIDVDNEHILAKEILGDLF